MLAKQMTVLGSADAAKIVPGASVPIILTSRANTTRTRLASSAAPAALAAPAASASDNMKRSWEDGAALNREALLEPRLDWVATHLGPATLLAAGRRSCVEARFHRSAQLDAAAWQGWMCDDGKFLRYKLTSAGQPNFAFLACEIA